MSLDVYLNATRKTEVYWANITHNLNKMAKKVKCGEHSLYEYLWRPDEIGVKQAGELILPLTEGLKELKKKPAFYKKYDSPNKWGVYEHFVPFVEEYLEACEQNPDAEIEVSR
jgi:hypothetical protein